MIGQLVKWYVPDARVLDWRTLSNGATFIPPRTFGANYLWEALPDLPCRPFTVTTHIDGRPATIDGARAYKGRVGKAYEVVNDTLPPQFQTTMPGYAVNLPSVEVEYGRHVHDIDTRNREVLVSGVGRIPYDWLVSTVPLYALLRMVGWRSLPLQYKPIWVKILACPPDSPVAEGDMYVNYLTGDVLPYRYTDRDGARHFESLRHMPGSQERILVPGKIYDHPAADSVRTRLLDRCIVCFGRYATWNSDELTHTSVNRILEWRHTWLRT